MVAPNKQRILAKLLTELSKAYKASIPNDLTVLDHLLIGVVQEETSFSAALPAYRALLESFFDLNELRVSHRREVQARLGAIPLAEAKAGRIVDILQFVFETTYAFDLESMRRKPLKQASKQLSKIAGTNPFIVAATVQRALGGHAIPIDKKMRDVLVRLGIVGASDEMTEVRAAMEHLIPKAKGIDFCLQLSELASDESRQDELVGAIQGKTAKRRPGSASPASASTRRAAKSPAAKAPGRKSSAPKK